VKQQAAVQRVVQPEEALERYEVERLELSQRLKAMASMRWPRRHRYGHTLQGHRFRLGGAHPLIGECTLCSSSYKIASNCRVSGYLQALLHRRVHRYAQRCMVGCHPCLPVLQQRMVLLVSSSQERVLTLSVPQGSSACQCSASECGELGNGAKVVAL
jgi:hypothetical protein